MKLEKAFLLVAIAAVILAVPIGYMAHYRQLLHVERSHTGALQLRLNTSQRQLQQRDTQLKAVQQDSSKQQQQIKNLQQQLTVKQATQRAVAARIAAAALMVPIAPPSSGLATGCGTYRGLVSQYGWNVSVALAIMRAESGCNPAAASPTCDHGLMQINCIHIDLVAGNLTALNDPATNIKIAYQLYSAKGWQPWTTFTSGAYLKYL